MFVPMAEIVRAVGLRGEVKLLLTGDYLVEVLESDYLRLREAEGTLRPARVLSLRPKGETVIIQLAGVDDRDAAEAMIGRELGYAAEDYDDADFPRPGQPAPFVYHGLTVRTREGRTLGRVDEVLVLPANLVLRVVDGEREHLIPVIPPVALELDRENECLTIEPLPGLLDDED